MKFNKLKSTLAASVLLACSTFGTANAVVVELSLVLDGSGSISAPEFALQTNAYANIFSNNFFDNFVNAGDTLHVNAIQFAGSVQQEIGWTAITSNAAASAFGGQFGAISQLGGATNTSAATDFAVASILGNGIAGDRQIIDVSTDGFPNNGGGQGGAIMAATDAANEGITVNAVGIGSGVGAAFLDDYTSVTGGFFVQANSFQDFEDVLARKIRREVTGEPPVSVPEPSSMILLGLGLIGAATARKKKLV